VPKLGSKLIPQLILDPIDIIWPGILLYLSLRTLNRGGLRIRLRGSLNQCRYYRRGSNVGTTIARSGVEMLVKLAKCFQHGAEHAIVWRRVCRCRARCYRHRRCDLAYWNGI
jgi:hypothetical protein